MPFEEDAARKRTGFDSEVGVRSFPVEFLAGTRLLGSSHFYANIHKLFIIYNTIFDRFLWYREKKNKKKTINKKVLSFRVYEKRLRRRPFSVRGWETRRRCGAILRLCDHAVKPGVHIRVFVRVSSSETSMTYDGETDFNVKIRPALRRGSLTRRKRVNGRQTLRTPSSLGPTRPFDASASESMHERQKQVQRDAEGTIVILSPGSTRRSSRCCVGGTSKYGAR